MRHRRTHKGFNLMELMVVVIIIGVLATLAIPQFTTSRERSLGQEARANLRLIAAAQRIYRLEMGFYYPSGGSESAVAIINSDLKLSLNENSWDYAISGAGANSFSASAARNGAGGYLDCQYGIDQADNLATGASCP